MSGPDQKLQGERIRELRTEQGLTQEAVTERTKISSVYLGRVKKGGTDVGLEVLKRIAEALKTPIASLIDEPVELSRKAIHFAREFDQAEPEIQTALLAVLASVPRARGQS